MISRHLLLLALVIGSPVYADKPKVIDELHGKVLGVLDGDTLTLHAAGKPLSIRLEGIDAPESGQKFGAESREALKKLVAGKEITVRKTGTDKYKHTLGIVIVDKTDVCAKMVADGWAWHFKTYNTDEELANLETEARAAKRGLWNDDFYVAPWDYRAEKKESSASSTPTSGSKPTRLQAAVVPPPSPPPVAHPEPSNSGMVWVNGYTRKNGTQVKGYWRRK
ncbi:MAG: thermonuclease family protein [Planctomycetaceae bacterium]